MLIRLISLISLLLVLTQCTQRSSDLSSQNEEILKDSIAQKNLFQQLMTVVKQTSNISVNDTIGYLIVPLRESCPSCLHKTIDYIIRYQDRFPEKRVIIISVNGGRKTINSFFRERKGELPNLPEKIILDSTNIAAELKMFKDNPAFFYTYSGMVHRKIFATPETIKDNLKVFFRREK